MTKIRTTTIVRPVKKYKTVTVAIPAARCTKKYSPAHKGRKHLDTTAADSVGATNKISSVDNVLKAGTITVTLTAGIPTDTVISTTLLMSKRDTLPTEPPEEPVKQEQVNLVVVKVYVPAENSSIEARSAIPTVTPAPNDILSFLRKYAAFDGVLPPTDTVAEFFTASANKPVNFTSVGPRIPIHTTSVPNNHSNSTAGFSNATTSLTNYSSTYISLPTYVSESSAPISVFTPNTNLTIPLPSASPRQKKYRSKHPAASVPTILPFPDVHKRPWDKENLNGSYEGEDTGQQEYNHHVDEGHKKHVHSHGEYEESSWRKIDTEYSNEWEQELSVEESDSDRNEYDYGYADGKKEGYLDGGVDGFKTGYANGKGDENDNGSHRSYEGGFEDDWWSE